ncbi:PAXX non-homologous end joining factor [Rhinolophus ferrumequinum]|uniref:PAXX non-homologous end joining factor n=2 Tax=Rhinolophus ferrumequinum TaxID=59479 RepID=A0A7J7VRI7_RHIFE|nr:PAXX non-homologous end joining factor [Rhinolophus ferrumequinum]
MVPVPVPPPLLSPPLCTLPPGTGPARFVCYCEGEGVGAKGQGGFNIYVTDAAELWSTCFTPESLAALVGRRSIPDRFRGALGTGLEPLQGARPRGSPQVAGTDTGPGRARVQLGAAADSCRGDSCQPQEELSAGGASAILTRPGSSERHPWTWRQEAVSWRVPHQPWLQE